MGYLRSERNPQRVHSESIEYSLGGIQKPWCMVGKNSYSLHSFIRFLVDPPDIGRPWDFLIGFALGVICSLGATLSVHGLIERRRGRLFQFPWRAEPIYSS